MAQAGLHHAAGDLLLLCGWRDSEEVRAVVAAADWLQAGCSPTSEAGMALTALESLRHHDTPGSWR
ncbi:hypothetical protein KCP70_08320 [Salmonella enterica subsp. enterica]|nr:hypothetical protein KCP70_08320 [Salmonella enterica subsp. enterica]